MKSVRRGVFETNSSSSHSLSLKQVSEITNRGKLKPEHTYEYKALGEKWNEDFYAKEYCTEFDKLCVCFDLLFFDYLGKAYKLGRVLPSELNKFREKDSDTEYLLTRRYVFNEFKKSNYFKEFKMVLKKHNIEFILNDLIVIGSYYKQRFPITCDNYGLDFDFMRAIAIPNGWQSVAEAVDSIVFNPNIVFEYDYVAFV